MNRTLLNVRKRTVLGKKVKNLRKSNILPGNIYGKGVPSLAVEVDKVEFLKIYKSAGESTVIELKLENEPLRPVLIHDLQIHPSSRAPLHIDFYQVNLKEKIKAKVPILAKGESDAVLQKLGVLLVLLNEIEVEALPMDLPDKILVNIANLKQVGDVLKIKDIEVPNGVSLLTPLEAEIFKVGELVVKETVVETVPQVVAEPGTGSGQDVAGSIETPAPEPKPVKEHAEKQDKEHRRKPEDK